MLRPRLLLCLLPLLVLVACSEDSTGPAPSPEALAQIEISGSGGTRALVDSLLYGFGIDGFLAVAPEDEDAGAVARKLQDALVELWMNPEDEGSVLRSDAGNSSGFEAVATLLTNGQDDFLSSRQDLEPGGAGSSSKAESAWLEGGLDGSWDPDLEGASISHVVVHVDRMRLDIPGSNPNNDGLWTDYELELRLVIYGLP